MSTLRDVQKEELGLEGTKMQERVDEVVARVVLVKQLSTQYRKFIVFKKKRLVNILISQVFSSSMFNHESLPLSLSRALSTFV